MKKIFSDARKSHEHFCFEWRIYTSKGHVFFKVMDSKDMIFSKSRYAFFIDNTIYIIISIYSILSYLSIHTIYTIHYLLIISHTPFLYILLFFPRYAVFQIEIAVSPLIQKKADIRFSKTMDIHGLKIASQTQFLTHI